MSQCETRSATTNETELFHVRSYRNEPNRFFCVKCRVRFAVSVVPQFCPVCGAYVLNVHWLRQDWETRDRVLFNIASPHKWTGEKITHETAALYRCWTDAETNRFQLLPSQPLPLP